MGYPGEESNLAMTNHLETAAAPAAVGQREPKIAILIVAYNAVSTLTQVLDRIPPEIWARVEEVLVFDDSSRDDTYLVGLGYKAKYGKAKLSVFRNEQNLGYGGNQKRGYRYAIDKGYDIVALVHGDGQYAPEMLPTLLEPLIRGEAEAVFGSRMLKAGEARKGGMPLYKFVGNKVLTGVENFLLGMDLSEFHSGYRLYSLNALEKLPFEKNTDDFHFDTQIIIQLHAAGMRIAEIPIPTYYGDEICHVNGMKYAKDVVRSVVDFKLHELGVKTEPRYEVPPAYTMKKSPWSSHARILELAGFTPKRILDVGSGQGELGHVLKTRGHTVVGVDMSPPKFELDEFIQADLSRGLPIAPARTFDIAILADVLEHMSDPLAFMRELKPHLAAGGFVIASIPNVVHWSVRAQMALGRFDYTNKGLLDRGHLRFFTRSSAHRFFQEAGFRVEDELTTPVPWENVIPPGPLDPVMRGVERTDFLLGKLRPNVFAYQHVFKLRAE